MADTFDGFPVAGSTRHFLVTYVSDADADARARAQAIAATCEADLSQLEKWFNCNYDDSPYSIWVHVYAGTVGGGADNYGYEDGDESSRIFVGGTYQPGSADPAANAIRDELARMLFVAELAEILMDFTGRGWNRGDSSGEALSRVAAAELHPQGYYGSGDGPVIQAWIESDQHDYVTSPEGSDSNPLSYGCCILFINYLRYQRGYSFPQIVQAGGSSLAETFSRLTVSPASDAFGPFLALLHQHIKYPRDFSSPKDNIFPLLDNASIGLLGNPQSLTPIREPGIHRIALRPGPICPESEYTYTIDDVPFQMSFKAVTRGLAHADFEWTLGGTPLPFHGLLETVNVNVRITDTTPGKDAPFVDSVPVRYLIQDGDNTSTLQFWNTTFPGNGDVDISVVATESQAKAIQVSVTENWPFHSRDFNMDARWTRDVKNCNPRFVDMSILVEKLGERIFTLKNTPDPPPGQLLALGADLDRYRTLLNELTGGLPGLQTSLMSASGSLRSVIEARRGVELPGIPGGLPTRTLNLPLPKRDAGPPNTGPGFRNRA